MSLSEEKLIENYEKFTRLLLETGEHRRSELQAMIDHFGDRLVLCPASSKIHYHNAFPGGLVDHSLRVLKYATRMLKILPDVYGPQSDESVVFACLLHDLGKIGDLENERYLPQTNNYYKEKGNAYEINQSMPMVTVTHASVFLLQHFGIKSTYPEWQAILLNDGPVTSDGKEYCMRETNLTLLVHQADRAACQLEKNSQ